MASPSGVEYSGARKVGLKASSRKNMMNGRIDRMTLDSLPSADRARIWRLSV
jgi:hypothetical protein